MESDHNKLISKFKRNNNRKSRLEILKKLPDPFEPAENDPAKMNNTDLEKLEDFIQSIKDGKSFLKYLHSKREFHNPENLNKIIDHHQLEQIGSNFPGNVYNPYTLVSRPEEFYDGIIKRQNELLIKFEVEKRRKEKNREKSILNKI